MGTRPAKRRSAAALVMASVLSSVFIAPEDLTVSQWASKYRQVGIRNTTAPWDNALTPYLVGVMDAYCDPRVRQISVIKGSQTGGTETLYNMLLWRVDCRPGLTMFVYPDADSAREQMSLRILPNIQSTPKVAARLGPKARDTKSMSIRFDRMDLVMRGAGGKTAGRAEHKLESLPADVFCDELDRCPLNTAHLARQRIKTKADGKIVFVGKPGLKGQGIDKEFSSSDQRRYYVPCPCCGIYHIRTFNRVRWWGKQRDGTMGPDSRDPHTDPFRAGRTAQYKCPEPDCKGMIAPQYNRWQLSLGVWAAEGQAVKRLRKSEVGTRNEETNPQSAIHNPQSDEDLRLRWVAEPGELLGPAPETDHAGFHIPGLISGLVSNPYSEAASGFCARKGRLDQDFLCDQLGEAWSPVGEKLDAIKLAERAKGSGYRLGQVPTLPEGKGGLILIAAADLQDDAAFVTVRAFGEYGRDRWHVWHERVPCPAKAGLESLDELLFKRTFTLIGARSGTIKIAYRGIDSGDGERTKEVYDYCRKRPRCYPMKGVWSEQMAGPHALAFVDKRPDGKVDTNGLRLLKVNSGLWKHDVMRRLKVAAVKGEAEGQVEVGVEGAEAPLAMGLGLDGAVGVWHFPEDTSPEYFSQLTSEQVIKEDKGGRITYRWAVRPGFQNHYFDAECYCEALFFAMGGRTLMGSAARPPANAGTPTAAQPASGSLRAMSGATLRGAAAGSLRARAR